MGNYCLCLGVVFAFSISTPEASGEHPALDQWQDAIDSLWSYDVYVTGEEQAFDKTEGKMWTIGKFAQRQRYSLGRWRADLVQGRRWYTDGTTDQWQLEKGEVRAFAHSNGVVRYFSNADMFGQLESIEQFKFNRLLMPQLFECFISHSHGETYPSLLTDRDVSIIEEGLLCFGSSRGRHTKAKSLFNVSLSASSGWLPETLRYGSDLSANSTFYKDVKNNLRMTSVGVYAPEKSVWSTYAMSFRASGPVNITTVNVDWDTARFNIDIPPDVFEVAFPVGTMVYDAESQRNFVQTAGNERDYKAAAEQIRKKSLKREKDFTPPESSLGRYLLFTNLVAVVIFLVFVVSRGRRR